MQFEADKKSCTLANYFLFLVKAAIGVIKVMSGFFERFFCEAFRFT